MRDATFNFLTKVRAENRALAMDQIWSIDHWLASVGRARKARILVGEPDLQVFELHFDAGNATVDEVLVRRERKGNRITVEHLVPPPGIIALNAAWWVRPDGPPFVYAHRKIVMEEGQATPAKLRQIQALLKANLTALVAPCSTAAFQTTDPQTQARVPEPEVA